VSKDIADLLHHTELSSCRDTDEFDIPNPSVPMEISSATAWYLERNLQMQCKDYETPVGCYPIPSLDEPLEVYGHKE